MGLGGTASGGGGAGDDVRREGRPVDELRRLGERGVVRVRGHGHPHLHVPPHGHLREVPQEPDEFAVAVAVAVGFFSWPEHDPFGRGVSSGVASEASSPLFSQNERVCKWSVGADARGADTHLHCAPRSSSSSNSSSALAAAACSLSSRAHFSASPSTARPCLVPPLSFKIHWEVAAETRRPESCVV